MISWISACSSAVSCSAPAKTTLGWVLGTGIPARRAVDRAAVERFLAFVGKPLSRVTPADLAAFWETLDDLTPAPRVGVQTAVSSLMTFGRRVGYLPGGRRRRPRPRS